MHKEIVNEIKYYQMYLSEIISDFCINESICDFFDEDRNKYIQYGICLGNISEALNYRQHMLCYLLFHYDRESKSIPRFLNRIKDTKIFKEADKDKKLKSIEEEMTKLIEEAKGDIESLKEYRYDVYAHWNKNIFNTEWQQNFKNEHPFNYVKMIDLCAHCYELLGDMLSLFGEQSFCKALIDKKHLNTFINQLKK